MIQAGLQLLLKTKRVAPNAKLPVRNNPNDAGLDLYALEKVEVDFGVVVKVKTGIAIELPPGTVGLILDRSSIGSKGIKVFGGVIDSDYRGEILVVLGRVATNWDDNIFEPYTINEGDKIAQLVVLPILLPIPYEVSELTDTSRGVNGFGSSGQ
jgi:dUTP pyrophosphatase